jgi:hypothetical protein
LFFFARGAAQDRLKGKAAKILRLVDELAAFESQRLQFLQEGNLFLLERLGRFAALPVFG